MDGVRYEAFDQGIGVGIDIGPLRWVRPFPNACRAQGISETFL
jgi:hypothetical protein